MRLIAVKTVALFFLALPVFANSITASATCQTFDGTNTAGPTCFIGPYFDNGNYVDVSAVYSVSSAITANEFSAGLTVAANASFGGASESATALFTVNTPGPLRPGYALVGGTGDGFETGGYAPLIAHPAATLNGAPVTLNLSDGWTQSAPYMIPIELGVPFTLDLSAYVVLPENYAVGGSFSGGVNVDVQLFEDPEGQLGDPVWLGGAPEPSEMIGALLFLAWVLKEKRGGFR
jgi:hypothetical protein